MELVTLTDGRLALRDTTRDCLLAVPPMHPLTAGPVRAQVLDYVARRQYGLAASVADIERELIELREHHMPGGNVATLMAETPHRMTGRAAA